MPSPRGTPAWTCPACLVEHAPVLLASGRADMARKLLEPVPDLVREMVGGAYALGHDRASGAARRRAGEGR